MRTDDEGEDWAASVLRLVENSGLSMNELAKAANLDPFAGDLHDIDLGDVDLTNEDLSGWQLGSANLTGAKLCGTNLRGASVDPISLVLADDWEQAKLDETTRKAALKAQMLATYLIPRTALDLSVRASVSLENGGIDYLGQIAQLTEAQILRTPNMGRKSLNQIRELLSEYGLHFGWKIPKTVQEKYFSPVERAFEERRRNRLESEGQAKDLDFLDQLDAQGTDEEVDLTAELLRALASTNDSDG